MPYEAANDKLLDEWRNYKTGLVVSVNSYNGGAAKVQIGPRRLEHNGRESFRRVGRLSLEDIDWLIENIDDIRESLLDETPKKSKKKKKGK